LWARAAQKRVRYNDRLRLRVRQIRYSSEEKKRNGNALSTEKKIWFKEVRRHESENAGQKRGTSRREETFRASSRGEKLRMKVQSNEDPDDTRRLTGKLRDFTKGGQQNRLVASKAEGGRAYGHKMLCKE